MMIDGLRTRALIDLLQRYRDVLLHAWKHRKENDAARFLPHEADFLPAALALREKPVSALPRVTMWLLLALAALTLLWAVLGKIDVVATAPGKLIPSDRTKIVQPMEAAIVSRIHVRDGDEVRAGDVLIDLDATEANADNERIANDLIVSQLQVARARAMLKALDEGRVGSLIAPPEASATQTFEAQTYLVGQFSEYEAQLSRIDAEMARRTQEAQSTRALIGKLEQTAPIAAQRARDLQALADRKFVSRHSYLEKEQFRIEQEADLAAQRGRLREIEAAKQEVKRQRAALTAETRRLHLDALNEGLQKVTALESERVKSETRVQLMHLTAPVDGTVQQLAIHTIGGVVTPAQALMAIVPRDNPVEVEAFLENKDVGFVKVGQDVEIKVETFQYTKYGTIPATVTNISNDAIPDEKRGLIYAMKIRLSRSEIEVDGRMVKLSPGMSVAAEIKTGKRRLIEYFLSPLMQYKNESFGER